MQKSFIFDLNKCTGCHACMIACSIENGLEPGRSWRRIITFNEFRYPELPQFHTSLACCHCLDPPCLRCCPAAAYSKDSEAGAVIVDPELCIGCKYCSWVCPYDAPVFNHATGIMEKCTFCEDRISRGLKPACVAICPTNALDFGNYIENGHLGDLPGFPETGIKPAVIFKRSKKFQNVPEVSARPGPEPVEAAYEIPITESKAKISLKSEWPLGVFTLLAAILTAWITASTITPMAIPFPVFITVGVAGLVLSAAHLGKKFRAYRALLNWRYSWLSKEIFFYCSFLAVSTLHLLLFPESKGAVWLAVITGYAALFSIDKVYQVIPQYGLKVHSSQLLFTGLFFSGVLSGNALIFGWFGVIKVYLYTFRKFTFRKYGKKIRPIVSILRLGLGFILPLILLYYTPREHYVLILACILAGEIIDRTEYYSEFEVISPGRQMKKDFEIARERNRKETISY